MSVAKFTFPFLFLSLFSLNRIYGANMDKYLTAPPIDIDSTEFGQHPGESATNCSCGWTNKNSRRIVGGTETGVNEYPMMAGLADGTYGFMFCGASIISPYHCLTAAHCTFDQKGNKLAVIVGEHDVFSNKETDATRTHMVKSVIEHEDYDPEHEHNDIALLVLQTKIEFTQKVGPVCLPTARFKLLHEVVKVVGWGKLRARGRSPRALQHTNLRIIPLKLCKDTFAADIPLARPRQLCTFNYRKDACQGDSGGPVMWLDPDTNMYTQVGLVSYGSGCGDEDPGVNTDVAHYIDWIQHKISETVPGTQTCSEV